MMTCLLFYLLILNLMPLDIGAFCLILLCVLSHESGRRMKAGLLALFAVCVVLFADSNGKLSPPDIGTSVLRGHVYRQSAKSFDLFPDDGDPRPILVYLKRGASYDDLESKFVELRGISPVRQITKNKNGFDIEKYIASKSYRYGVYAKELRIIGEDSTVFKAETNPYRKFISGIRRSVKTKAAMLSSRSKESFDALILGAIPADSELGDLAKSIGIVHLFVVSGFHFSLVYGCLFAFSNLIFGRRMFISIGVSLTVAMIYYSVLGGGFGAGRAFFCIILGRICYFAKKDYDPEQALAIAAVFWILANPFVLRQTGFVLSFLASFVIAISSRFRLIARIEAPFLKSVLVSFIVFLVMSVFLSFSTGIIQPFSFLFCAIISIFMLFYLPVLFLYAFIPLPPDLNQQFAALIDRATELMYNFLGAFKPLENLNFSIHPCLAYSVFVIIILLFALYKFCNMKIFWKKQLPILVAASVLLLFPLFDRNSFEIISYDLKDGDSSLIKIRDKTILYDVGNDSSLVNLLRADGIYDIDLLVLSHADQDHIGIVDEIFENFNVKKTYVGEVEEKLELCDMNLSFWTLPVDGVSRNDKSIVMRIDVMGTSALFTGDIQLDGIEYTMTHNVDVDVLKLPHHGSYTENLPELIEAADADLAFISGGRKKNIAKKMTLKYLGENERRFYDTILHGELRLYFDGSTWRKE